MSSQEFLASLEGWVDQQAAQPFLSGPALSAEEERRLRRMISNRESARRSRLRKQQRLKELTAQLSCLKSENSNLSNRLGFVIHYSQLFRLDNDRLRSESALLSRRLAEIRRTLFYRRLATQASALVCGGFASGTSGEPNLSSVIV